MDGESTDPSDETGITDDDRRQIRRYLRKHPTRRCIDDLRPETDTVGDD